MTALPVLVRTEAARLDADLAEALHRRLREELKATLQLVAMLDRGIDGPGKARLWSS